MYKIVQELTGSKQEPTYHSAERFWDAYPEMFKGRNPIKKEILVKEVNKKTMGSFEKAKRLLGWAPEVEMKEGLREMIDFVRLAIKEGKVGDDAPVAWKP